MQNVNWQKYTEIAAHIPEKLAEWITYPGQFTARLKNFGIDTVDINVLHQAWELPEKDESQLLAVLEPALIREVMITAQNRELMFARTVFPKNLLTGKEAELANLGNRSLGSFLFQYPNLKRSEFEIAYLSFFSAWARRSFFHLKNKSLLLTEVFLPAILEL